MTVFALVFQVLPLLGAVITILNVNYACFLFLIFRKGGDGE